MSSAFPVDYKIDFAGYRIYICHDFFNQCSNDAFLQTNIRIRVLLHCFQFRSQFQELFLTRYRHILLSLRVLIDPRLQFPDSLQGYIPTSLQFIGDQTILGIGAVVLFLRSLCGITRRFQISPQCLQNLVSFADFFFSGHYRRLHCGWLYDAKQLLADRFIDRCSSKRDASRLPIVQPTAMTAIADNIVVLSRVVHYQFATATSAPQQTAQESRAALNCPGSMPSTHIVTNRQLNLFELLPADIARVRTRN